MNKIVAVRDVVIGGALLLEIALRYLFTRPAKVKHGSQLDRQILA